jgi:diguanylate cyclase (GGDEF)-like protein/PAS domain S-box-containing protein
MQNNPYSLLMFLSALVMGALAYWAWQRRPVAGATPFALLMFAMAVYALFYGLELVSNDLSVILIWIRLEYLGIAPIPALLLLLVIEYTGKEHLLTNRNLVGLFAIPIITLCLISTTEWHQFYYQGLRLETVNGYKILEVTTGPWYWVQNFYAYSAVCIGALALVRLIRRSIGLQRYQAGAMLLGIIAPWITHIAYLAGLTPLRRLDLTPFAFMGTGLAIAWGLFGFRLFEVIPAARERVIDSLHDGVMILDLQNQLADCNPAAQRIFGWQQTPLGQPAASIFRDWPDMARLCLSPEIGSIESHRQLGDSTCLYELTSTPVTNARGQLIGRAIVAHDITRRKQIEEAERRQRTLAEALRDTAAILNSSLELEQVMDKILANVSRVVKYDAADLLVIEAGVARVARRHGMPESWPEASTRTLRLPVADTPSLRRMVETGKPVIYSDVRQHPEWLRFPEVNWVQSYAGAPIKLAEQVVGFINVTCATPGCYTEEDAKRLEALADQAAIALQNAQRFEQAQRQADEMSTIADELSTINDISLAITSGRGLAHVLQILHEQCSRIAPVDAFYVALYDEETDMVRFPLFVDRGQPVLVNAQKVDELTGATGHVIRHRTLFFTPDLLAPDANLPAPTVMVGDEHSRAYLAAPLLWEKRVIGVISIQSYQADAFTSNHVRLMQAIANQAAIAIENARLFDEMQLAKDEAEAANRGLQQVMTELDQLATTDKLTRAYNRRKFDELVAYEIGRAERYQQVLSLIMFDIDHFKLVNDTHGHHVGDKVLVELTRMVKANIRSTDTLTRWGGEEFIILAPGIDLHKATKMAEKIRVAVAGHTFSEAGHLTISLGAVEYQLGDTPDNLLRRVDNALYRAKEQGRNRVENDLVSSQMSVTHKL